MATPLGVGERYLRKLFQRELGISPQAVAQNQRLLFAKKLLIESSMPNRPPYDWEGIINFFSRPAGRPCVNCAAMNYQYFDTPIGTLRLVSDGDYLTRIEFEGSHQIANDDTETVDRILRAASAQLDEYFAGKRESFDLPLKAGGTEFQQSVWSALVRIPHGEMRSYSDIAHDIGRPKAVRAVGAANGRNPLPVIVPCHRVIGRDGSLTGFAGGLAMKTRLLQLEGGLPGTSNPSSDWQR